MEKMNVKDRGKQHYSEAEENTYMEFKINTDLKSVACICF